MKIQTKKEETICEELTSAFKRNSKLKTAFEKLTSGRKRVYILFFNEAKKPQTRTERITKYTPRILKGYGMGDCICGLSKKMPKCDGSHNQLK